MPSAVQSPSSKVFKKSLNAKQIQERGLVFKATGERVPLMTGEVYRIGNKHFFFDGSIKTQAVRSDGVTQGRYLYYSRQAVPPEAEVLGHGGRHAPTYVKEGNIHIPIYKKDNLRKFIFLYPDGSTVPPTTQLRLAGLKNVYAEQNGQTVLLTRQIVKNKNALPMFRGIVTSLKPTAAVPADNGSSAFALGHEGNRTPTREPEEASDNVFSPGTLSLFSGVLAAAPEIPEGAEEGNRTPLRALEGDDYDPL